MNATALCESGRRWRIHNGNYFGGLQFTLPTWRSVGGHDQPNQATRLEQEYRAVRVLHAYGVATQWPVCGVRYDTLLPT